MIVKRICRPTNGAGFPLSVVEVYLSRQNVARTRTGTNQKGILKLTQRYQIWNAANFNFKEHQTSRQDNTNNNRSKHRYPSMMTTLYNDDIDTKYESFPLVQSMLRHEETRTNSLKEQGKYQINYPLSSDGWISSIFIVQGRALDWMIGPWLIVVGHAALYTTLQEILFNTESSKRETDTWEIFFRYECHALFVRYAVLILYVLIPVEYSLSLNSTLAFLLVFRLNRAASRYWSARHYWGDIVAQTRSFVGGIIVHGDHDRFHRDEAIRWVAAFSIATMDLLRGETDIRDDNYAGILIEKQIDTLKAQRHQPVYAADQVRFNIKQLFCVDASTPMSISMSRTQELNSLEQQLNTMIWCGGGMERIKGTPLPMVYVSHLRTFLILNLIILPYIFGPSWGWITIPIVALSGFAWMGIESAAMEVERPFFQTRVNSLNMDGYILGLLTTIQQQLKNHADYAIEQKSG